MRREEKAAPGRRSRCLSARVAILALLTKDSRELTARQIRAEVPGGLTLRNLNRHLEQLERGDAGGDDRGRYRPS